MNCNEVLSFAALVILLLLSMGPSSGEARLAHRRGRLLCNSDDERPFWLRNKCFDGFVTVNRRKVVAQHKGVNQYSDNVELVKESCKKHPSDFDDEVYARLYSKTSHRYICFNRKGKLRSMTRQRADRMGLRCAFVEEVVRPTGSDPEDFYIRLRSAANPSWYLGFAGSGRRGSARRIVRNSNGDAFTLPRKMRPGQSILHRNNHTKCDFLFSTGKFAKHKVDYSGLYSLFEQEITKAAEAKASYVIENSIQDSPNKMISESPPKVHLLRRRYRKKLPQQRRHPSRKSRFGYRRTNRV